jgi:hypothetical protein
MIDKGKNQADLRDKVLQAGGTINRPELADEERRRLTDIDRVLLCLFAPASAA